MRINTTPRIIHRRRLSAISDAPISLMSLVGRGLGWLWLDVKTREKYDIFISNKN
jgi:hypothetical protein